MFSIEVSRPERRCFSELILFKFFNRVDTWERLESKIGPIVWKEFEFDRYAKILDSIAEQQRPIYSAAYIMPSPSFGYRRKHRNHLRLFQHMMLDGAPFRIERARSLQEVFEILRSYPSLGNFLAFQFAIDLNYSAMLDFSEMDFVVAGPGARSGIRKCFADTGGLDDADVIRAVTEMADREFDRLGLSFRTLVGATSSTSRLPEYILRSRQICADCSPGVQWHRGTNSDQSSASHPSRSACRNGIRRSGI